jgi:hypothetical protein
MVAWMSETVNGGIEVVLIATELEAFSDKC